MVKLFDITSAISQALQILESKEKIEDEKKQQLAKISRSALHKAERYGEISRIARFSNRG